MEYGNIKLATEETPSLKKYYDAKFEKAVEILKQKYDLEKATSLHERRSFKNILNMLDAKRHPEILIKSKELVVQDYFNKLIKDGKTKVFDI